MVRIRFMIFCEYGKVVIGMGSEGFIYIKRVSEGGRHVSRAAASSDVDEVACRWKCIITVTTDASRLNGKAPTIWNYG